MQFKMPKNDEKYHWTNHVMQKMMYYGLSADRVKRVIRAPQRAEEGIAENTIAVMQKAGSTKNPQEIWVMYAEKRDKQQETRDKKKVVGKNISLVPGLMSHKKIIITAWRYPGVSPVRDRVPLPEGLMAELERENLV